MKSARGLIFSLVAVLSMVSSAHAQTIPPYQITPDGREYELLLGPDQKELAEVSLYFVSAGNISTAVDVKALAPLGTKISARGGILRTADALSALSASNLILPHRLRTITSPKREQPEVPFGPSDEFPGYGAVHAWYHLQKDTCTGGPSSQYVTAIKLDLRGVNPAEFDNNFLIRIVVKEFRFSGGKVASIKPSSDGKYRGEPILLMQSVASGGEYVNIVDWANGKIRSQKRIPVVKYVGYKGYGLSLARLNGSLNGGRATFELSNGGDLYGVCFSKTRTRQSVNGYPAPN